MVTTTTGTSRVERVRAVAERILGVALLAVVVGIGYFAYLLAGGDQLIVGFNRLSPEQQQRVFASLGTAANLVTYGTWVVLAALVIRSWQAPEWGYAPLLAGGIAQLAVPQFLRFAILQQGGASSPASAFIIATFRDAGTVALFVGAVLVARDLIDRLSARHMQRRIAASRDTSPARVRNLPLDARQDRFLGKCWELPMCRPAIRQACPVFVRGKQPCWRIGVGCMCSEEVLIMAARTRGDDLTQPGAARGNWTPQRFSLEQLASRLTPGQKRDRCMNCAIYLHHQAQKYRALLPVVACGVVILMASLLPWFHRGFVAMAHAADRFAAPLAPERSSGAGLHPAIKEWSGRLADAYAAEWILFFCLGVVVLSYALRGLEYAVTRRGL